MLDRRQFCLLLVGSLLATPSFARRGRGGRRYNEDDLPPRFRGGGLRRGVKYTGETMSRTELEKCVLEQEEIDQLGSAIDEKKIEILKLENQIQASENHIKKEEAQIDLYRQSSVNKFNSLLSPHKKLVERYNAQLPQYNKLIEQQNSAVSVFNSECTTDSYYIDDMIYVLKKLGLYG